MDGDKEAEAIAIDAGSDQENYPHGFRLAIIVASLAASVFLCALVRSVPNPETLNDVCPSLIRLCTG